MFRPADSGYDRDWAAMSAVLLWDLQQEGRKVSGYTTGYVVVDGIDISPEDWDRLCAWYSQGADLTEIEEAIGL